MSTSLIRPRLTQWTRWLPFCFAVATLCLGCGDDVADDVEVAVGEGGRGFIGIALWVAFFGVLLVSWSKFWRNVYRLELGQDATYHARTNDGWRLAMHRYQGGGTEPVLLCHGLGANAFGFDLSARFSLARRLRNAGFDVWVVELRGVGHSRYRDRAARAHRSWSFDDYVRYDIPSVIGAVCRISGHAGVHWVGHSLGGMAIYAYLGTNADERVRSICTLAAPSGFEGIGPAGQLANLLGAASVLPKPPLPFLAGLAIPIYFSTGWAHWTHNGKNVDTRTVRLALANLTQGLSRRLLRQLSYMLRQRKMVSFSGNRDYTAAMNMIRVPACIIGGAADRLATAHDVRRAYDLLGSRLKEYHLMGRDTGCTTDYGHGDIIIGLTAPKEVYPIVRQWLSDRLAGRTVPRRDSSGVTHPAMLRPGELTAGPPERPTGQFKRKRRVVRPLNPYNPYDRLRRECRAQGIHVGPPPHDDAQAPPAQPAGPVRKAKRRRLPRFLR